MLIYVAVALVFVAVIWAGYRNFKLMRAELSDAEMLEVMEAEGADMSVPHRFDFYIECADMDQAKQVQNALGDAPFSYEFDDTDEAGIVLMSAYLEMEPTLVNIDQHVARVKSAVGDLGTYSDWSYMISEPS